jgi:hypothetical protein
MVPGASADQIVRAVAVGEADVAGHVIAVNVEAGQWGRQFV